MKPIPSLTEENIRYLVDHNVDALFSKMLSRVLKKRGSKETLFDTLEEVLKEAETIDQRSESYQASTPSPQELPVPKDDHVDQVRQQSQDTVRSYLSSLHHHFQFCISQEATTVEGLLMKAATIQTLMENFLFAVVPAVRTVVLQRFLPPEKQEIPRANEISYLWNGVLITIGTNEEIVKDLGRDSAAKHLLNERRGLSAVIGTLSQQLHVPMCAVVQFLGESVWVQYQVPVSKDSLVYGEQEGTRIADFVGGGSVRETFETLNLKGHRTSGTQTVFGPSDCKVFLCQSDGLTYCMETGRLFPPLVTECHPSPNSKSAKFMQYRLRPEAVALSLTPLNSDAFSPYGTSQSDEEDVERVCKLVMNREIPEFIKDLSSLSPESLTEVNATTVSSMAHARGINVCLLGRVLHSLPSSPGAIVLQVELAARAFKSVMHDKWAALKARRAIKSALDCALSTLVDLQCSDVFWRSVLNPTMNAKFGVQKVIERVSLPSVMLLQRAADLCGIHLPSELSIGFASASISHAVYSKIELSATCKPVRLEMCQSLNWAAAGRSQKALDICAHISTQVESVVGCDSPYLVQHIKRNAQILACLGESYIPRAEACLSRILMLRKADPSFEYGQISVLLELARLALRRRKCELAVNYCDSAHDLCVKNLGKSHPLSAVILNHMGAAHSLRADWMKAFATFKDALDIRREAFEFNHPLVAQSLILLGAVYNATAQPADALPLLRQSLSIFQAASTSASALQVGHAMFHIAMAECLAGNSTAIQQFNQALSVLDTHQSTDTNQLLMCTQYARALASGATITFNEEDYVRTAFIYAVGSTLERGDTANDSQCQPMDLHDTGANSFAYFEKQVGNLEAELGPNSIEFASFIAQYGELYRKNRRYKEALHWLGRAHAIRIAALGGEHPLTCDAVLTIVDVLEDLGDLANASDMIKQDEAVGGCG